MTKPKKAKDVWEISADDFPENQPLDEQFKFLIGCAALAPSSHNTQPWKFKIAEGQIEIFADDVRWLRVADADKREMFISVGCALENLLVAASRFGFEAKTEYFPQAGEENFAARVSLSPDSETKYDAGLFEFIPLRSTFHGSFSEKEIPGEILREIENCRQEKGIHLYLTGDEKVRERVDYLIAESDAMQFADLAFREELAYWIGQGAFGNSWLMAQIGSLAVAYLDLGKSTAKKDRKVLQSAPVLGLLATEDNDRASQIKTGQIFERIYLTARKFGLGVRPMSQIVQIPEHKEELKRLIPQHYVYPQQPFLLGFAEFNETHTPRRAVEEILI